MPELILPNYLAQELKALSSEISSLQFPRHPPRMSTINQSPIWSLFLTSEWHREGPKVESFQIDWITQISDMYGAQHPSGYPFRERLPVF